MKYSSQHMLPSFQNKRLTSHPKQVEYFGSLTICTDCIALFSADPKSVLPKYRVFKLKVDRQLSREYFTSDAVYNGSAGMTLYYYMCRSWQDCGRRGENRSWPSVSVESVDSECWVLNNAIFYAFIMRLRVEECVFISESYLKAMSYAHCRQSFFEKFIGAIRETRSS